MPDKILIREEFQKCPNCHTTVTFKYIPGDVEISLQSELAASQRQVAELQEKLARADRALTMIANNPFCQDTCKGVAEIALKAYREVGSDG